MHKTSVSSFLGESIGIELLGCAVNSHVTFRSCQSVYMILQPYQQQQRVLELSFVELGISCISHVCRDEDGEGSSHLLLVTIGQ